MFYPAVSGPDIEREGIKSEFFHEGESLDEHNLDEETGMKPIILDKNYLQGIPQSKFQELSEQVQFIMPDALFYELIKDDDPVRSGYFRKFYQKSNQILVPSVPELLREELAEHKPAGLPSEYLLPEESWQFNPELLKGTYILTDDDKATIREIDAELDGDAERLMDFDGLESLFPGIRTGTDEERKNYKSECEQYIANNIEKLSNFLSKIEPQDGATMPPSDILNKSWTLIRWLQIRLLFSLDIYDRRYDGADYSECTPKTKEKIKHDVLDMWYLILGVLQRGFATKEKKLVRFYKLLCPDGTLLTKCSGKYHIIQPANLP